MPMQAPVILSWAAIGFCCRMNIRCASGTFGFTARAWGISRRRMRGPDHPARNASFAESYRRLEAFAPGATGPVVDTDDAQDVQI